MTENNESLKNRTVISPYTVSIAAAWTLLIAGLALSDAWSVHKLVQSLINSHSSSTLPGELFTAQMQAHIYNRSLIFGVVWFLGIFAIGLFSGFIRHKVQECSRALAALTNSENRFRLMAENFPDIIYRQCLSSGKYEYISPASIKITGYTPKEMCEWQTPVRKIIHPDWIDYMEEQWKKMLRGSNPPFIEYQIIHKSGDTKWIYQTNVIIYNDSGLPVATEGILTDITERRQIEKQLNASIDVERNKGTEYTIAFKKKTKTGSAENV
jgi:PAS domain S-box-containing protein